MAKKIGLLGGMSPESTVEYYLHITRAYTSRFGDYNYPEIIIYSVSFQPYVDWQHQERWDQVAQGLGAAAHCLEAAGADFIVIATNTMHLVLDQIQAHVRIPILSLLDVVANAIQGQGLRTVGLLGTKFTMEKSFYHQALARQGVAVLVPSADERRYINEVIYKELVAGTIHAESRAGFIQVIQNLVQQGAEGIILGCTEIPLLVTQAHVAVPLFDSTRLHAEAALNYALQD